MQRNWERVMMLILTMLLVGRAMTLAFILRAGGTMPGDPPSAWLMPLVGDAIIGVTGLVIVYLIWRRRGLWVWTTIVAWNAIAIWDALSAYIIHITNPWPEFFMIQLLGSSMFFAATMMHLVNILLAARPNARRQLLGQL